MVKGIDIETARLAYVAARGTDTESAARQELERLTAQAKHEFWSERAAIREYDGGMSRADAEIAALGDVERE